MTLISYAFLVILCSFQIHTIEAYALSPLVSRIITRPIVSSRHSFEFASHGSDRVNNRLLLNRKLSENGPKLLSVPQKKMTRNLVCYVTKENESSKEEDVQRKTWMRKFYNLTFGKLLSLFLHLAKILVKNPLQKIKKALNKDSVSSKDEDMTTKINYKIDLSSGKVVNQDVMCSGEKNVYCRCWKSAKFPLCDGAHVEHNKISGDNVGPLIISVEKETVEAQAEKLQALPVKEKVRSSVISSDSFNSNVSTTDPIQTVTNNIPFFASEVVKFFSPVTKEKEEEEVASKANQESSTVSMERKNPPTGQRWAVSSPDVDLSGKWKMVASDDFKVNYDIYLKNLGQPSLVRSVAVSIVELTTEEISQLDEGRTVRIKGINLRGVWDRTLVASGSDYSSHHNPDQDEHLRIPLVTADNEEVQAEAWWEENGTVHVSWLRGVKKYGGGDFESRRFLENGRLICESAFHPNGADKLKAVIRWTFERMS